jgi:WD40 repeat protein
VAARRELFTLRGHADIVYSVTFSRDGRYIASGSLDRTVKIWDAHTPSEVKRDASGANDRHALASEASPQRDAPATPPTSKGGR